MTRFEQSYTTYLQDRSSIGNWILHNVYLRYTASLTRGCVIDFGCGIGDLLRYCAPGSIGLDVNKSSVDVCVQSGLDARVYDPERDDYSLRSLEPGRFGTLVISHVLEHLHEPDQVLRKLLAGCRRLQVQRLIVKVPCQKGFRHDATHVTMIDPAYLEAKSLLLVEGFQVSKRRFFPFNLAFVGNFFTFNELIVVYDSLAKKA